MQLIKAPYAPARYRISWIMQIALTIMSIEKQRACKSSDAESKKDNKHQKRSHTVLTSATLNVFVGVVQAFQKLPFLHVYAPTGTEPPFAAAQGLVLLLFAVSTVFAVRKFHPVR